MRLQTLGAGDWRLTSGFLGSKKRVWVLELGKLEGASAFCVWRVSEVKRGDVPKPFFGV
jgi:hypothetical protein